MNTMEDLRRELAIRLRDTLHGKEIDMVEEITPEIPHMLGITPLDTIHEPSYEDGTILDPQNSFWNEYEETVNTRNAVDRKVTTAIQSLQENNLLDITYPYGEEAEIVYVEVEIPETTNPTIQTSCENCGTGIPTEPNLLQHNSSYYLSFALNCPNCDFHEHVETDLQYL